MPAALEWRQASSDQQEEPLLLRVSAPASHYTTSPPPNHSDAHSDTAASHSDVVDAHDCQPSSFTLPPAVLSPSSKRPVSSSSHSSPASATSCCRPLPLLIHFALLCTVLASLHFVCLSFQQTQLRCTVLAASHLLSHTSSPAYWWWDFGTLLGLTREHDIIYTEVDADLSVTWQQRDRIWQQWAAADGAAQAVWKQFGFVQMEQRTQWDPQDVKLRLYDSWGWFLDIDVWDEVPADAAKWRMPTAPSPDRTQPDPAVSMQMVTGRLEPAQYVLPSTLFYPLASIPPPAHWLSACPHIASLLPGVPSVQVPASVERVLVHWYGSGWREPRKFDKGRDRSNDWFEVWMWQKAVRVYELLWAAKVVARVTLNGLQYHRLLLAYYALVVGAGFIAMARAGYRWQRRHPMVEREASGLPAAATERFKLLRQDVRLAVSPLMCATAYVSVLWVVLFTFEYQWYIHLGWGMWRGLLVGLALPLVAFHIAGNGASSGARVHSRGHKQADTV